MPENISDFIEIFQALKSSFQSRSENKHDGSRWLGFLFDVPIQSI